jgi:hypothetical protein
VVHIALTANIRGFHWGPSESSLDETLNWGVAVMLEAGPPIDTIFSLHLKDEMVTLDQRLRVLMSDTSSAAARAGRNPG